MKIPLSRIGRATVPGHRVPEVGFEAPFEMLQACHERVARTLRLLERLRRHLDERGPDEQAAEAARDIVRYFDLAAPHHHEDEERHVFPRLLAGPDEAVKAVVHRLRQDHVDMAADWAAVRPVLQAVAEGAPAGWDGLTEADRAALARFAGVYEDHIRAEEDLVYPAARAVTDAAGLRRMGGEMAARRTARP